MMSLYFKLYSRESRNFITATNRFFQVANTAAFLKSLLIKFEPGWVLLVKYTIFFLTKQSLKSKLTIKESPRFFNSGIPIWKNYPGF